MTARAREPRVEKFCDWLRRRGRSEGTVEVYRYNLEACLRHPGGITARLLDKKLAPKTRRTNQATLAAWAKFSKDHELKDELSELKLPPASRVKPKLPLDPPDWKRYVQHVQSAKMDEVVRCVILIMAMRGLRISDVLRIKRKDAVSSLSTGRLIYEGKGGKQIEISVLPIRGPVKDLVDMGSWTQVVDLLGDVKPLCAANRVRRTVASCAKTIGLKEVHPHRLRRSYATAFLKRYSGDPQALPKLVQHMAWSGIAVAMGYIDSVDRDELDRAGAEMVAELLE